MIKVKMKIDHNARKVLIEGNGDKFASNGIKKALIEIGMHVDKELDKGISNPPKSGVKYPSQRRRSSNGGEYPSSQSGTLKNSINRKIFGKERLIVGLKAPYAKYLEEGTSKMEKRKLLGFTIEKDRNKIRDIFRKNINGELKNG